MMSDDDDDDDVDVDDDDGLRGHLSVGEHSNFKDGNSCGPLKTPYTPQMGDSRLLSVGTVAANLGQTQCEQLPQPQQPIVVHGVDAEGFVRVTDLLKLQRYQPAPVLMHKEEDQRLTSENDIALVPYKTEVEEANLMILSLQSENASLKSDATWLHQELVATRTQFDQSKEEWAETVMYLKAANSKYSEQLESKDMEIAKLKAEAKSHMSLQDRLKEVEVNSEDEIEAVNARLFEAVGKLQACRDDAKEQSEGLRQHNKRLAIEMQLQRAQHGRAVAESEAAMAIKDRANAIDKLQIWILENRNEVLSSQIEMSEEVHQLDAQMRSSESRAAIHMLQTIVEEVP
eukprot:4344765-Karenia_brevis.AAC.1